MINVRANYKHRQQDDSCPLCSSSGGVEKRQDSQEHLLKCKMLDVENEVIESDVKYEDIFGSILSKQTKITLLLKNRYKKRKELEGKVNLH